MNKNITSYDDVIWNFLQNKFFFIFQFYIKIKNKKWNKINKVYMKILFCIFIYTI